MGLLTKVRREGKMYETEDEFPCTSATTNDELAALLQRALIALRLAHGTNDTDGANREHTEGVLYRFGAKMLLEKEGETPVTIRWAWQRAWPTRGQTDFGTLAARFLMERPARTTRLSIKRRRAPWPLPAPEKPTAS